MHAAVQDVEWILGELPNSERAGFSGELWLQSIHPASGLMYRKALLSDIEAPMIAGQVQEIAAMLEGQGPLPLATLGLPVEAAIVRRKAQMATQAQGRREKQLEEADRNPQSRHNRFCVDAEKELNGFDPSTFLHTKRADMHDMTPLELAEDSEAGSASAREALSAFLWQRRRDAEKAEYQDKIRTGKRAPFPRGRRCVSEGTRGRLRPNESPEYVKDANWRNGRISLEVLSKNRRGWSAPSQARRALIMVAVARIYANENSIIQWTCYLRMPSRLVGSRPLGIALLQ